MATFEGALSRPSISIHLDDKEATAACFSDDGSWLAVSYNIGIIEVYKVKDGSYCFTLNQNSVEKCPFTSLCFRSLEGPFSTKNVFISCDVSGKINHWHTTSTKLMSTLEEPGNEIFTVAHQETGALFATAGLDAKVRVYDGLEMKLCKILEDGDGSSTAGHTNRIFALRWNPLDEYTILSGGWDSTIQIWDLRVGKSVRSIFGPYLCGPSIDFDRNTSRVLTGSWRENDQLQEWDYGSGNMIRTFAWPQIMNKACHIYSACYGNMAHNLVAAGGSASNQASIFHCETGQLVGGIYDMDKGVICVSFDRAGTHLCVISLNEIYIVNLQESLSSITGTLRT